MESEFVCLQNGGMRFSGKLYLKGAVRGRTAVPVQSLLGR